MPSKTTSAISTSRPRIQTADPARSRRNWRYHGADPLVGLEARSLPRRQGRRRTRLVRWPHDRRVLGAEPARRCSTSRALGQSVAGSRASPIASRTKPATRAGTISAFTISGASGRPRSPAPTSTPCWSATGAGGTIWRRS